MRVSLHKSGVRRRRNRTKDNNECSEYVFVVEKVNVENTLDVVDVGGKREDLAEDFSKEKRAPPLMLHDTAQSRLRLCTVSQG